MSLELQRWPIVVDRRARVRQSVAMAMRRAVGHVSVPLTTVAGAAKTLTCTITYSLGIRLRATKLWSAASDPTELLLY